MKSIDSATLICCNSVKKFRLVVSALSLTFLMLSSSASALPASVVRMMGIVEAMSSQLLGLVLVSALLGIFVIADRRRRSRVRPSPA